MLHFEDGIREDLLQAAASASGGGNGSVLLSIPQRLQVVPGCSRSDQKHRRPRYVVHLSSAGSYIAFIACGTLKTEYEKICFRPPPPQAAVETEAFCTAFRSSCKSLVATPSKANDDPGKLRKQRKTRTNTPVILI